MAWYEIEHRCGHTTRHQIYGTNMRGEREAQARGLAQRLCPDCACQQRCEHRTALVAELALPELERGSDKQRAWAESIRARTVEHLDGHDPLLAIIRQQRDARWWIDHRTGNGHALAAVVALSGPTEADQAAAEQRTRSLLATESFTDVEDPHWQRGTGTPRPAPLRLRPAAARAWQLWSALARQHATDAPDPDIVADDLHAAFGDTLQAHAVFDGLFPRVDDAVIRAWITQCPDPVAAQLVTTAYDDATSTPRRWGEIPVAGWDVAQHLREQHDTLDPVPSAPTVPKQETHCRHGRPYTEDCSDCDADTA